MTSQTLAQSASPVRRSLQADGIFSAVNGLFYTLDAEAIRAFLGLESSIPILVIGLILLVYGGGLFYYASNKRIELNVVRGIMVLNALWIIASVLILAFDLFHLTTEGRWAILILTDLVAAFGIWEYLGMRQMARN